LDRATRAEILLELLKLRKDIAVVCLIDELRQENAADREQLARELGSLFDHRRVQAFEDSGIRFERELQKLTELPIRLLRLFIFELLRNREERPLQVRWRQIDSAPIGIGAARVETKRARPDHAAEDDEAVPVHVISGGLD